MSAGMVDGLRGWAASELRRDQPQARLDHGGWSVELRRAPVGVVGFVFEGRPNVFADAVGVLRTGNTVVFRIGSDALGTAQAIMSHAVAPALASAGLPAGAVSLVESAAHAAGWALFSDRRLSLAVARGSGPAVAQLGAVARQAGIPVSLHGTGGAWIVAAADADRERFVASVMHSLDRKVCNTRQRVLHRARAARPSSCRRSSTPPRQRLSSGGQDARIHATSAAIAFVPDAARSASAHVARADGVHEEPFVSELDVEQLGEEWEWERSPEVAVHVVDSVAEAVALHNRLSPRFVASLISESAEEHDRFFATVDAPFVGDGFTRLGRRSVRARHARARPVELGARPDPRQRSDPLRRQRLTRSAIEPTSRTPTHIARTNTWRQNQRDQTPGRCRYSQTPLMSTTRWTAFCEKRHRSPSLLSFTIAPLAVTRCCGVMLRFDASGRAPQG